MLRIKITILLVVTTFYCGFLFGQTDSTESFQISWKDLLMDSANVLLLENRVDSFFSSADSLSVTEFPHSQKTLSRFFSFWRNRLDSNGSRARYNSLIGQVPSDPSDCESSTQYWQPFGPFEPVGQARGRGVGFVFSSWIHPTDHDTIIAGFAGGGLYRTMDGGDVWTSLWNGRSVFSLGVYEVEADPSNVDNILVSVGRDGLGAGLIYTTDGGVNWIQSHYAKPYTSVDDDYMIRDVQIKGPSLSQSYAVSNKKFIRTTDGFQSGTGNSNTIADAPFNTTWTTVSTNHSDMVFAAGFSADQLALYRWNHSLSSGVFLTANIDLDLANISSFESFSVDCPDDINRAQYVYLLVAYRDLTGGGHTSLQKSSDNGDTFVEIAEFNGSNTFGAFASSPNNENEFYTGRVEAHKIFLDQLTNNWVYDDDHSHPNIVPATFPSWMHADIREIDIVDSAGEDIIYWSTDGGLYKSYGTSEFHDITAKNLNNWMVLDFVNGEFNGTTFSGVEHGGTNYRDSDGEWYNVGGGDGGSIIHAQETQILYTQASGLLHAHELDPGGSLINEPGYPPSYTSQSFNGVWHRFVAAPLALDYGGVDIYAGYDDLYRVSILNDQFVWNNLTSNLSNNDILSIAVTESDNDLIVFSNNKPVDSELTLYKSVDNGNSWDNISPTGLNGFYHITTSVINPADQDEIWIGLNGVSPVESQERVFRTLDGGLTWSDISNGLVDKLPV